MAASVWLVRHGERIDFGTQGKRGGVDAGRLG